MRQRWMVWVVLWVVSAGAAPAAVELQRIGGPVALGRGGSGASCHCPCQITGCNCMTHSESCHRCYAITITVAPDLLGAMLSSTETPVLEAAYASWFEAAPHAELNVRLEATMAGSGQAREMQIRFLPDPDVPSRYVPDTSFDGRAYAAWARQVDRGHSAVLSVGTKDDPATWRIRDGNPQHLNESLAKSFRLVRRDGSRLEVFRSESTLGWEANLYLRSVVAGIPADALLGEGGEGRSALASLVDVVDLQVKAGDAAGAVTSLDALIDTAKNRWLDPGKDDTRGAICGFRKIRNLLVPGSSCS
jgi:hypothetical protein